MSPVLLLIPLYCFNSLQDHFKQALSYLLFDGTEEYDINVVSVGPAGIHIMVEFFAVGRHSKKILNTTTAYYKLTEKGQDYRYTSYHIVHVDMKGTPLVHSSHHIGYYGFSVRGVYVLLCM